LSEPRGSIHNLEEMILSKRLLSVLSEEDRERLRSELATYDAAQLIEEHLRALNDKEVLVLLEQARKKPAKK
jgi:hypothetical protein